MPADLRRSQRPPVDPELPEPSEPHPLRVLGAVGAGAMAGGTLRYGLGRLLPGSPAGLPWPTLTANTAGSFLLALAVVLILRRSRPGHYLRPFLATGLLGSFTTFSALALELVRALASGRALLGLGYAAASLLLGLTAAAGGLALGRNWPARTAR